ncbi:MAG: FHA domain-containing protein [Clostridia bacterium]|nr:FHA domain-containing protein [Clostridia bacterium]
MIDVNEVLIKCLFWVFSIFALMVVAFIAFLWPVLGILALLFLLLIMCAVFFAKPDWWRMVRPRKEKPPEERPVKGFAAEMMLESCVGQEPIVICKPEMIIGRKDTCDYVLNSPSVSREHCKITYKETTHLYYIEDLDSAYGTFINAGRLPKCSPTLLKPNSMVTLSDQRYIFKAIR